MIVLDGGRKDMMSDTEFMPKLNERVKDGAHMDILTNPITMTASCVKEIATGVPSRPNEGLNNFHPVHPGTPDGWNMASVHDGMEMESMTTNSEYWGIMFGETCIQIERLSHS